MLHSESRACLNSNWAKDLLENYCYYFRNKVLNYKPLYYIFNV